MNHTKDSILNLLENVKDPEVPVISVVELGVVRDVLVNSKDDVVVKITPTYSGCPALHVMEQEIIDELKHNNIQNPRVEVVLSPAWSTDWISDAARIKLKNFGIAPPQFRGVDLVKIGPVEIEVPCPYCDSTETECTSQFGPTACKSLWRCNKCRQPFEYFKDF